MVNGGKIPATIADDYILDLWRKDWPGVKANREVSVSQDGILAWVTRKDNAKLVEAMNAFFATHRLTFQ
jgi:membrane-bound lytic murein transglycosylase MltF